MRKTLSFVLVLALVLGSFSMAFAATPTTGLSDVAGNANAEAIQVVYDLGIVTGNPDGTFLPAKAVNRAEFAAMITRALAVNDSALAGFSSTSFKDTKGYDWAVKYLAFCESKGIILGDGMGNVMPGRTITVNEAVTMALRAIGYTNNSDALYGTWPANYVTLAQEKDLYDDVAAVVTVDKANAAQIINNLLTVEKVSVNSEGTTTVSTKSLLTAGLNCSVTTGSITAALYDASVINVADMLGQYGTIYTNSDNDMVAFSADSVALYGKLKSTDATKFVADGVEYNLGAFSGATVADLTIQNGSADTSTSLTNMLAYADSDNVTLNVKLTGKTITTLYSVVAWKATDSGKATATDVKDIANKKVFGQAFLLDADDAIDLTQFKLVGAANLSAIEKDDVVYVYEDSTKIRMVAVGTATVAGKVTEKDGNTVYINGKAYDRADLVAENAAVAAAPALGDTVTLFLDADGNYYAKDITSKSAGKYGVVTAYSASTSTFTDNKAKIYTSDDSSSILTFVDMEDVTFTTGSTFLTAALAQTNGAFPTFPTTAALVGYDVDATGKIDVLNGSTVSASGITLKSNVLLGNYIVASDVKVFTYVTSAAPSATFDVSSIGSVDKNVALNGIQYILNSDGEVAALLVNYADTDGATSDVFGVIDTVTEVKNSDDVTVNKLVGFIGGVAFTKTAADATEGDTATTIGLYKFTLNTDGTVKTAALNPATASVAAIAAGTSFNVTTGGIENSGTILTADNGTKYAVSASVLVYEVTKNADGTADVYAVGSIGDISEGDSVYLYDTKTGTDHDNVADVIIYVAN